MPNAPLLVDCDVERIGRVIDNLLTNAIKYSPDGGPVEVSVLEHRDYAIVEVLDHGIGIPATGRERLFEPGYRTGNAAAVAEGLGLGLYIASAIVRRHGGTIQVAERVSGGSIFTVRLPLSGSQPAPSGDRIANQSVGSSYQYAS
jgi:signal transduction histidine kinase